MKLPTNMSACKECKGILPAVGALGAEIGLVGAEVESGGIEVESGGTRDDAAGVWGGGTIATVCSESRATAGAKEAKYHCRLSGSNSCSHSQWPAASHSTLNTLQAVGVQ